MSDFYARSACCHREIIVVHGIEYPTESKVWGLPYKYDACSCCGIEVMDTVLECAVCGVVGCLGTCEEETKP